MRAAALVSAPICASGVGDGCAELAADSPLIAELQARSAEKREQRRKESLERYSVNNFNDFFAVDNKSLVRHADGTFEALPKDVIAEGLKSGRIKYGARSAGIAAFSTTRAPFEFIYAPFSARPEYAELWRAKDDSLTPGGPFGSALRLKTLVLLLERPPS